MTFLMLFCTFARVTRKLIAMFLKTNLIITLLLFVAVTVNVNAQTKSSAVSKLFNRAVDYSRNGDYSQAIPLFKKVAKQEPENVNVLYNLGHCYVNSGGQDSAAAYFQRGIDLLEEDQYNTELGVELHLSLAKSKQLSYKFDEAIAIYKNMLGFVDEDQQGLREIVDREIEISNNAIVMVKNPVKLEVHNLGSEINSKYDDHSPLVNADETIMLLTSRRRSSYSQIMPDGQFAEKIYLSFNVWDNWGEADEVVSVLKSDGHESGVCLSADGSELYLLRSDFDGQNLYVSEFDGENWSEPYKLPEGINSRYHETHASISSDKSVLFFTSDRKGGYGGLDIYMVRKLPNGQWGTPRNLGSEINTEFDEETPMIHPDGKTLFFSSDGHKTMGKFDIFYSKVEADSSWSEPVNMGYPINTPDDDFFFVPTVAENRAYMASSRFEENYGGSDLYMIEYEAPIVDKLAVIKGKLDAGREYPWDEVVIYVKEKGKEELVGEYRPNPVSGEYLMILEVDKTYDVTYTGESIQPKDIELAVTREMTYSFMDKSYDHGAMAVKGIYGADEAEGQIAKAEKTEGEKEDRDKLAGAGTISGTHTESLVQSGGQNQGKYTVQFVTLKEPLENYNRYKHLDHDKIMVYKCKDGNYRYVYGGFTYFKDAKKVKEEVKKATGYDDPFVRYFWQLDEMKVEE